MNRTVRSLTQMTLFQFRALYRNKLALFFNLIFPLLMVAIFGGMFGLPNADSAATTAATETTINTFDYLIPGQLTVMLLSAGFITIGISMASQRESGVLRHLFSTPLSIGGWAGTRIAANLAMAVLQCTILFVFARLLFNVAAPTNLPGTAIVILVSTIASLSMGMLVGTLAKGEEAAVAITMPLIMALFFLGNAAMPLENPPPFIAAIMPYIPTYHMTNAMRAVMRHGAGVGSILTELAILAGLAALLLGISLWRLRRQYVVK